MNWLIYAILSAIFASITSILAKVGLKDINSNLATAIRTTVILLFTWSIVFFQHSSKDIKYISRSSAIFLILSGLATGLSWLFYFKALSIGDVSKVISIDKLSLIFAIILSAIFLGEKVTIATIVGSLLITLGTLLITFAK